VSSRGFRPLLSRSQYRNWLENSLTRNAAPQSISARKTHAVTVCLVDSCRTRMPSIATLSNGKHTKTSANAENHALYPHLRNLGFWDLHFLSERYRNGGAGVNFQFNQTASSASPSPTCSSSSIPNDPGCPIQGSSAKNPSDLPRLSVLSSAVRLPRFVFATRLCISSSSMPIQRRGYIELGYSSAISLMNV
jgi:hypothetical protein